MKSEKREQDCWLSHSTVSVLGEQTGSKLSTERAGAQLEKGLVWKLRQGYWKDLQRGALVMREDRGMLYKKRVLETEIGKLSHDREARVTKGETVWINRVTHLGSVVETGNRSLIWCYLGRWCRHTNQPGQEEICWLPGDWKQCSVEGLKTIVQEDQTYRRRAIAQQKPGQKIVHLCFY